MRKTQLKTAGRAYCSLDAKPEQSPDAQSHEDESSSEASDKKVREIELMQAIKKSGLSKTEIIVLLSA